MSAPFADTVDGDTGNALLIHTLDNNGITVTAAFTGLVANDFISMKFILDAISGGNIYVKGMYFLYN